MATFICYMFYKHTVLAVGDIFFALQITSDPSIIAVMFAVLVVAK